MCILTKKQSEKMASLKVSIEHVCLQEWNLSASWLQGDFNAWTFTDTIILPSLHHHLKCICLNLFHLPLSCPMFFPALAVFSPPISISLHSSYFSTVSPSSLSWNLSCCFFKTCAVTGKMTYHKALSLPCGYAPERAASGTDPHTHDHGVWPEVPAINHHYRAFS